MLTALGVLMTAGGLFLFLWYRTVVGLPESTRPAGARRIPFKWGIPFLGALSFLLGLLPLARESLWHGLGGMAVSAVLAFVLIRFDRYAAAMRIIYDHYRKMRAARAKIKIVKVCMHHFAITIYWMIDEVMHVTLCMHALIRPP